MRAGRALIGIVALLGVCLALQVPQAAAGVVLAERGRVESAVVTSVENGGVTADGRDRYLCSVADRNGVPLKVRIGRGCQGMTRPGDALAVIYDPKGHIPPRGVEPGAGVSGCCAVWPGGSSPSSSALRPPSFAPFGFPALPMPRSPRGRDGAARR